MLNGARFVSVAAIGLAFAGCGSTKQTTTTTTTAPPEPGLRAARTSAQPGPPVATTTYSATLTVTREAPAGAPKGSAVALIGINGPNHEICYTFSEVKNIKPTAASLQGNVKIGRTFTPLGHGYASSGCQQVSPILLRLIESEPHKFQVSLANGHQPLRAIRGAL